MTMVSVVKGCPLFHELYDEEIEEIVKHCMVASYETGDYIIKCGDTSTDIFVILSGHAEITVPIEGKSKFIATLTKEDIFGELVLINETKRTANIMCIENTDVLIISYENFYSFFNKNPRVFALMLLNVTRLLTKRLKNSNIIIEDLSSRLENF